MSANPSTPAAAPVRLRGGLLLFVAFMVAPAFIATAIVGGAWAVSDEVYAAERVGASASADAPQVAPWKSTLVGICPLH